MNQNPSQKKVFHGRGATHNPANRFEKLLIEPDLESENDEYLLRTRIKTEYFKDSSKTIISYNDSPDIPFETSVNPYRGCEHGCIYCYARPTHEYFGLSSGLDFETKIFVKEQAPILLRKELAKKSWKPQTVVMSGVTDCYQPIERKLKITRGCLEVLLDFRNPTVIITKNRLVARDVDLLKQMSIYQGVAVFVSLTTLNHDLARTMEPRTSSPKARLEAIKILHEAGVPVGTLLAPIIPGLTDHEIPLILKEAVKAGAQFAGYTVLRLPYALKDLFEDWLVQHFPDRKEKILNRIRALREGSLNDPQFGSRMSGKGIFAEQIRNFFVVGSHKAGMPDHFPELSIQSFRNPQEKQLMLFD